MSSPVQSSHPPSPSPQLNDLLATFTHESPVLSNEGISNDRSNIYNSYIPPISSLQTSQVASTGRDQALRRLGLKTLLERSSRGLVTEVGFAFLFFSQCQGLLTRNSHILHRLWLPTETDSVALLSTSSSTSSASTAPRSSWFTQATTHRPPLPLPTNSLRTSSQLTPSSSAVCKDGVQQKTEHEEGTNKGQDGEKKRKAGAMLSHTRKKRKIEGLMRSLKVRIYPNARQKDLMKKWMGCAR
jgi:hypothetical protein